MLPYPCASTIYVIYVAAKIIHVWILFITSYSVAYLVGMRMRLNIRDNQFFQWLDYISGDRNMRLLKFIKVITPVKMQ